MPINNETICFEINETTTTILGMTTYQCAPYAYHLRTRGHIIDEDASSEQAYVMLWMLKIYSKHGEDWKNEVCRRLNFAHKIVK